ncbi:MAG TPA: hypothetical protein VF904_04840 [Anaeromyxobacteraceae bacterium]
MRYYLYRELYGSNIRPGAPLADGERAHKGCWIAAAAVYGLTGRVQSSKLFHLVLAADAFAAALSALVAVPRLGRAAAVACAALAALDTIAVVQLFTVYVDGQIASAITRPAVRT